MRIPVKELLKEAISNNNSYLKDIRAYIKTKWPDTNNNTISGQLIRCTVNLPSRIYHGGNDKPRIIDSNSKNDLFFRVDKGKYVLYDPKDHGSWEIAIIDNKLVVRPYDKEDIIVGDSNFADEKQLQRFITQHLDDFDLELYIDEENEEKDGIEYLCGDKGWRIDILAKKKDIDEFVVIELKSNRDPDKVVSQILRYIAWVRKHIANGRPVSGIIITFFTDNKMKYAISEHSDIKIYEYSLNIEYKEVSLN